MGYTKYTDAMYGEHEISDYLLELANTPEILRLKDISQDALPRKLVPWLTPTRYAHSLGVSLLAKSASYRNLNLTRRQEQMFIISALYHDAGNPPFSHLSEPFLKSITGCDGESFLGTVLKNSESERILNALSFSIHDIVSCVTGKMPPLSVALNGSMDVDNLDNVGRYWFVAHDGEKRFDAMKIAESFRFDGVEWTLDAASDAIRAEYQEWQLARADVYGMIYEKPHLNACMMISRALALACEKGEIMEPFFRLTDDQATEYLVSRCNEASARLVRYASEKFFYDEAVAIVTAMPSPKLSALCEQGYDGNVRTKIADAIADRFIVPREDVCAYVGKGRDTRRIELPFVLADKSRVYDCFKKPPIYRIKVYVPEYLMRFQFSIQKMVHEMCAES